jgi:hypothetical protein
VIDVEFGANLPEVLACIRMGGSPGVVVLRLPA